MALADPLTSKFAGFGTTIFAEMSALAVETGVVNLDQGLPDTDGPSEVLDRAVEAIRLGVGQRPSNVFVLVSPDGMATRYRKIDPLGEVLATGTGGETVLLADLDPAHVASTRNRFRFLQDRRRQHHDTPPRHKEK